MERPVPDSTEHRASRLRFKGRLFLIGFCCCFVPEVLSAEDAFGPESVLRTLVQANADKDLAAMARFMSQDADAIGYSIGGRKYVGWEPFANEMRGEFASVERLEIPITDLRLWSHNDITWFAMELDYIRHVKTETQSQRMVIPLRETGVLQRRDGRWVLVLWHESLRNQSPEPVLVNDAAQEPRAPAEASSDAASPAATLTQEFDLSGQWEVLEVEENKTYQATLDRHGNGPYTWQGGEFTTTSFKDRQWRGTWKQTGNDREGAFEIVLSEDGTQAKGIWWYTRVGTNKDIPPRQHGGSYVWKRLSPLPVPQQETSTTKK